MLAGLPVQCYIDNTFISSDTEEEHLDLLEKVVLRLKDNGMKIGLSKCDIGMAHVKYLGLLIGRNEIKDVPGYLDGLEPGTLKQLESAVGKLG